MIGGAGPSHFVIDAIAKPGFERGETEVSGWFASAAPPLNDSGEVAGKCAQGRCELTADLDGRKITFSGALIGATGSVQGRFEVSGDLAAEQLTKGSATFTLFTDTVPGLGDLVKPDAIDSRELDDLLLWAAISPAFGDDRSHPIESFQHEHIASWQQSNERPINGLLLVEDLELLKDQRDKAQKAAGWKTVGGVDQGWSAGYPTALLPVASRKGAEQHFASADGKAELVVEIGPALSDDDFDALSDRLHEEASTTADANTLNFARTGPDIDYAYTKAGKAFESVYYNRKRGLARLTYVHPAGEGPLSDIAGPIAGSLRMSDADSAAP
jgi:hypothetical protein